MRRSTFVGWRAVCAGALAVLAGVGAIVSPANAQDFPARPIHVIVPFAPGGPVDVLARALGEGFRERTGQTFIVENKPGANTSIGAAACKNAEADGYTICLLTASTVSLNPFLYANLSYDPAKDLEPVTNVVLVQQVLLVHNSVPAANFSELARYSEANPDKLNFGSFGVGGDSHLVIEWLKAKTGAKLTHVPFAGAAPGLVAFERGDVHALFLVAGPAVVDKIRGGLAKGMLVSGRSRNPNLPDVPSFGDAGLPVLEFETWFGMFGPVRTPKERIDKIAREASAVIRSEAFQGKYISSAGYVGVGNTPEEFAKFLTEDRPRAEELVKASGVRLTQQ